jgi:arsenate reductase
MAEAFLQDMAGDLLRVESAGLKPQPINPLVKAVMAEAGFDLSDKQSDSVFDFYKEGRLYDYVITVCDDLTEAQCPVFPGVTTRLHWPFPDPEQLTGTDDQKLVKLRKIRDSIKQKLADWIEEVKSLPSE